MRALGLAKKATLDYQPLPYQRLLLASTLMSSSGQDSEAEPGGAEEPGELPAEAAAAAGDTIARRTRTQLSLVDVPIDALEGLLPDADVVEQVASWRENLSDGASIGAKCTFMGLMTFLLCGLGLVSMHLNPMARVRWANRGRR